MVRKMGTESKLNTIVLKWSVLNLLSAISAEITFDRDESATLVPYSLTTHKIVTVLPVADNATNVVMEEAKNGNGVKFKRLSQKRLDDEIRTKLNKEAKNSTKNLKIIKTNFTLPTLQKLVNVAARRKLTLGHRKKHHNKGAVLSLADNTKELSWSGETESESRSYNYDPAYPLYNYGSPTTDSGEDFMSSFKDIWNGYPEHESQNPTFPSLTTTYAPKVVQDSVPVNNDYSFSDWRPPAVSPPRFRRPLAMDEPPIYVDYIDDTRVISLDHLGRYWHSHGHPPILIRTGYHHRFQDEDSIEYQPHRTHDSGHHGWDYSKLAVALLTKIGLFKMKVFVLLKLAILFLFKLKLLLMALFLKMLILAKVAKLIKAMMLAALVPLIAMILTPLLALLPMLLSMIRVPVFVPDEPEMPAEMKHDDTDIAESSRAPLTPATLLHYKMILSSEQCLKRLVCELAAHEKPSVRSLLISRILDVISVAIPYETVSTKVKAYVEIYKSGLQSHRNQTETWCSSQYECSHFRNRTVIS